MIHVLLPTRGRPEQLQSSLFSLHALASGDSFAVHLALDPDDIITIEKVTDPKFPFPVSVWTTPERLGYARLYKYYNGLAERLSVAPDDLLLLWNDDAIIQTRGWDSRLLEADPSALVLDLQSNLSPTFVCFPALRGVLYTTLGFFSRETPHVDSYLQDLTRALGRVRPVDVFVEHNRPDLTGRLADATFLEGREGLRHEEYFSPRFQALIASDVERLRDLI